MDTTQWDNVDQHIIRKDGGTLIGLALVGASAALCIWQALHPVKKYREEISRPGDPIAWPWSKQR